MNKYFYPALFSKEGNKYNVKFIDFEDIFTFGDSLEDAYYMAQDALYAMLPELTLNYMNIKVQKNEFISMVELDVLEHEKKMSSKIVNTTVTMPEWLKNFTRGFET